MNEVQDLVIPEGEDINEKGWYFRESIETHTEMLSRVKECVRDLKEQHRASPDGTIVLISHGCFLRYLFMYLTN